METLIFALFPLVWVLPCLIGALGIRFKQNAWARALLIASMMAATLAVCGGSPNAQIAVALLSGVAAFVALDLYGIRAGARSPRAVRSGEAPTFRNPESSGPAHAHRPATVTPGKEREKAHGRGNQQVAGEPERRRQTPSASAAVNPPGSWGETSRYEQERRAGLKPHAANHDSQEGRNRQAKAQGPVEIIMPAERAVLRHPSQSRGYWIARTSNGDVEVYLPPGAEAYRGRPISIVAKPNGTLLGVPLTVSR
ncbi:hypothetical protein [Burkholderia cenocepacia]|uniref:hypothetical protein n=1 Tax=Burkholderia cenocepacia TaxID=95486 RepID=UPI00123741A8|nr:hypothetical protein [Burkholderia cenocepacia]